MKPSGKLIIIAVLVLILVLVHELLPSISGKETYSQKAVFSYMNKEKNQKEVLTEAINLNGGKSSNACVYFVSEVLRRNGVEVPKDICNTSQLISYLSKEGWKKDISYSNLKPGDLCFTTDSLGNKSGTPTHTYIFMGWVKEGSFDYAYICDNQAKDYEDKIYHIRNIKIVDEANGFSKDAFSFFMRPQM